MLQDVIRWYVAPWSRVGRWGFNAAWLVASIPALLGMLMGVGDMAGGGMAPLMDVMGLKDGFATGDTVAMQAALLNLQQQAAAEGVPVDAGIDWFWWLDSAVWLALFPLVTMRLRDVGVKSHAVWGWAGAFYAGTVLGWVQAAVLVDFGMMVGVVAGLLSFGVMAWLCVAPSAARTAPRGVTPPPPSGRVVGDEQGGFKR